MKRKNLLALLCAAVLMAASAACNAGSGDTARLAASAPAASGQPVSSQEAGSRPAETGSPAQAADTAAETGLSSPPAAADSQASRPADSRDTGHTPQPTAAREETEDQNVSEKPSEQNETLPSSQNGSAADIQSVEQSSENVTCEVGTPSLDLDAWMADANAHGDLIFTSSWGSVAAVPEKREYPVGTPSIQATIAVNIPGGYSLHSQDDAYTLQKKIDGAWVKVPTPGRDIICGIMGPIEGEPLFCKSYDLTIFDPDWMTAGEYRIPDGENLNRTDGVQPVQFTFSFSLTEN